jgi:Tfp pilus assembly protein PilF
VQAFKEMERDVDRPGFKGRLFATYKNLGSCLLSMGDLAQTEIYVTKAGALLREARGGATSAYTARPGRRMCASWPASSIATKVNSRPSKASAG